MNQPNNFAERIALHAGATLRRQGWAARPASRGEFWTEPRENGAVRRVWINARKYPELVRARYYCATPEIRDAVADLLEQRATGTVLDLAQVDRDRSDHQDEALRHHVEVRIDCSAAGETLAPSAVDAEAIGEALASVADQADARE